MAEDVCYYKDVVEHSNRFGMWKGEQFTAFSNFYVDFDCEVYKPATSSQESQPLGYICSVVYRDGRELGKAFFTCKDAENPSKWTESLRTALHFQSLTCNANRTQLVSYLMMKLEMNMTDVEGGELSRKIAAHHIGLHEATSGSQRVWILNEHLQLDENGERINSSQSPYVWIPGLLNSSLASQATFSKKKRKPAKELVQALQGCYQENFPAALLTVGAQALSLHYEAIQKEVGQVPAAVLFGEVDVGKTRATKAALSLLGVDEVNFFSSISDARVSHLTTETTLGIVIDDPSDPHDITHKIMHHFKKSEAQSFSSSCSPRCTFLTSLNNDCLQKLVSLHPKHITRVVLIPFSAVVESPLTSTERRKADKCLSHAMSAASQSARLMISLGKALTGSKADEEMEGIISRVESLLPQGTKHRLVMSYGWLMLATLKFLQKTKLRDGLEDSVWSFFEDQVIPAIKLYQISNRGARPFEELLVQAASEETTSLSEILTFLRADKDLESEPAFSILIPQLAQHLRSKGIPYEKELLDDPVSFYPGSSRCGILHSFLARGSDLNEIPKGRQARQKSKDTVYQRCIQIKKASFSDTAVTLLDQATKQGKSFSDGAGGIPKGSPGSSTLHSLHARHSAESPLVPCTSAAVVSSSHHASPSVLVTSSVASIPTVSPVQLSQHTPRHGVSTFNHVQDKLSLKTSLATSTPITSLSETKTPSCSITVPSVIVSHANSPTSLIVSPVSHANSPSILLPVSASKHTSPSQSHQASPRKTLRRRRAYMSRVLASPYHRLRTPSKPSPPSATSGARRKLLKTLEVCIRDASPQKQDRRKKKGDSIKTNHCSHCSKRFTRKDHPTLVGCDVCPRWYHNKCVQIQDISQHWECPACSH